MVQVPGDVRALARTAARVVVLTGAGMSAESGLATFRESPGALWERFSPEDLATPEAFAADPALVWGWYLGRVRLLRQARPNAGHHALARWAERTRVQVITQNVDDLHERAGSAVLAHLHGSLTAFRCVVHAHPYPLDLAALPDEPVQRVEPPRCPRCGSRIRPGVVWFGENLPAGAMEAAADAVRDADLVLVVGTSGLVYPAARLPGLATQYGVPVVEINPAPSELTPYADAFWQASAATALPALVDALDRTADHDVTEAR